MADASNWRATNNSPLSSESDDVVGPRLSSRWREARVGTRDGRLKTKHIYFTTRTGTTEQPDRHTDKVKRSPPMRARELVDRNKRGGVK